MEECVKLMSETENKISEIADKINNDYLDLEECKVDYKTVLDSWNEAKENINATINDSKKVIRQVCSGC